MNFEVAGFPEAGMLVRTHWLQRPLNLLVIKVRGTPLTVAFDRPEQPSAIR